MIFPVFDNKFEVQIPMREGKPAHYVPVSCLESLSVSFDNGVEEFKPLEEKGWTRRMLTGKAFSITLNGKRDVGNEGNDYINSFSFSTGRDAVAHFRWTMVDDTCVDFDGVVNVTALGGDSTNVDALEVEFLSEGKPTVISPIKIPFKGTNEMGETVTLGTVKVFEGDYLKKEDVLKYAFSKDATDPTFWVGLEDGPTLRGDKVFNTPVTKEWRIIAEESAFISVYAEKITSIYTNEARTFYLGGVISSYTGSIPDAELNKFKDPGSELHLLITHDGWDTISSDEVYTNQKIPLLNSLTQCALSDYGTREKSNYSINVHDLQDDTVIATVPVKYAGQSLPFDELNKYQIALNKSGEPYWEDCETHEPYFNGADYHIYQSIDIKEIPVVIELVNEYGDTLNTLYWTNFGSIDQETMYEHFGTPQYGYCFFDGYQEGEQVTYPLITLDTIYKIIDKDSGGGGKPEPEPSPDPWPGGGDSGGGGNPEPGM